MPEELFDADGKAITAFTEEEVNKRLDEAKTQAETEKDEAIEAAKKEVQSEISQKEEELKSKEEELKKALEASDDEKTKNIVALRKAKEDLERDLKNTKEEYKKGIQDILSKTDSKRVDEAIKAVVGEDSETAEKVKEKIDLLKKTMDGIPQDGKELSKMVVDAYTLAIGKRPESKINFDSISSGGAGRTGEPGSKGKISDEGKEPGKKGFGLTDEDFEKAGF
jgi:DNA repair exonuclease SbcCD ATPase subunit